jgi:4-amino-4-deoxy-L-arabinose transferase-like glycosyltransferase
MTIAIETEPRRNTRFVWNFGAATAFCMLAFLIRLPTFLRSAINPDESLYFLMAESWRTGHLPYTTLFDNKPIGVYAIFASFIGIFGDHIYAIRFAAILAVATTAFFTAKISELLVEAPEGSRRIFAAFAGFLYVMSSVLNDGMASNTEIFMSPLVCGALYLALKQGDASWRFSTVLSIGLLVGCACLVKPVASLETPAVLFALAYGHAKGESIAVRQWGAALGFLVRRYFRRSMLATAVALAMGALIPVLLVFLLYFSAGQMHVLVASTIVSNLTRIAVPFSRGTAMRAMLDQLLLAPIYLGSLLFFVFSFSRSSSRSTRGPVVILISIWLAGGFAGVVVQKQFFPHYFLQLLPALCTATTLVLARSWIGSQERGTDADVTAILLLMFVASGEFAAAAAAAQADLKPALRQENPGLGWLKDTPAQVAAAIIPELSRSSGETIYVLDYEPIIYSLAHVPPPTRYAFPPFLIDTNMAAMARIDAGREVQRILALHPLFIVRTTNMRGPANPRNDQVYELVDRYMAKHYERFRTFAEATVYRRRDSDAVGATAKTALKAGSGIGER